MLQGPSLHVHMKGGAKTSRDTVHEGNLREGTLVTSMFVRGTFVRECSREATSRATADLGYGQLLRMCRSIPHWKHITFPFPCQSLTCCPWRVGICCIDGVYCTCIVWFPFPPNCPMAGMDPGFLKGGGTPKLSGRNLEINDIHDHLINVRSNMKAVAVEIKRLLLLR